MTEAVKINSAQMDEKLFVFFFVNVLQQKYSSINLLTPSNYSSRTLAKIILTRNFLVEIELLVDTILLYLRIYIYDL